MPNCAIVGCDYELSTKDGSSYSSYKIPKEPEHLRAKWLQALNRENFEPSESTSICQKHFAEEAFIPEEEDLTKRGKKRAKRSLKPLSFPTLNMRPKKIAKARKTRTSTEAANTSAELATNMEVETMPSEVIQEALKTWR